MSVFGTVRGLDIAAAAQVEDLALGGFEGLPQLVDLVPVSLLERAQLRGEGADDAARSVLVGRGRLWWRSVLLLGPQVFDTLAAMRKAFASTPPGRILPKPRCMMRPAWRSSRQLGVST